MSRIIGGSGRGRRLRTPRGSATRPTSSRVRQTLFDVLAPRVAGSRFLDLFAGSGGVGLEALSRGAGRVVFVEHASAAAAAIEQNLNALGALGRIGSLWREDVLTALRGLGRRGQAFDLVYLDPPWDSELYAPVLELLARGPLLSYDSLTVAEHFKKRALPERIGRLVRVRLLRVGEHDLSFYRMEE